MMLDLFIGVISFIILVVCVLISVAFFTLFERSVLGYIQIRSGPNRAHSETEDLYLKWKDKLIFTM